MKILFGVLFAMSLCVSVEAKPKQHAAISLASVISAPIVHPKRTAKQVLGSALFAVENGVDVVHGGLVLADRAFDVLSIGGKIPALDIIYAGVSVGATDTGKLDTWIERQEGFLFGYHN